MCSPAWPLPLDPYRQEEEEADLQKGFFTFTDFLFRNMGTSPTCTPGTPEAQLQSQQPPALLVKGSVSGCHMWLCIE